MRCFPRAGLFWDICHQFKGIRRSTATGPAADYTPFMNTANQFYKINSFEF
jgi:hypothetical protein